MLGSAATAAWPLPITAEGADRIAVVPATRLATKPTTPPLTVTPAFGPVIVSVSPVLVSSSCVPVKVIFCGVAKTCLSKVMVDIPEESRLAKATASGRLRSPVRGEREALVVFTTKQRA